MRTSVKIVLLKVINIFYNVSPIFFIIFLEEMLQWKNNNIGGIPYYVICEDTKETHHSFKRWLLIFFKNFDEFFQCWSFSFFIKIVVVLSFSLWSNHPTIIYRTTRNIWRLATWRNWNVFIIHFDDSSIEWLFPCYTIVPRSWVSRERMVQTVYI